MKKLYLYICIALCILPFLLEAQTAVDFNWESIGPDNFGGRTRTIVSTKDGKLFAGSIGGGLWMSSDGGYFWEPVPGFNKTGADPEQAVNRCMSVSSIAIDPSNTNVMYVGTGEMVFNYNTIGIVDGYSVSNLDQLNEFNKGYLGFVGMPGQGVFISTDGGKTFSNTNATWDIGNTYPITNYNSNNPFISIQKVAVAENGRVFIATPTGVYYSDDKLANVQQPIEAHGITLKGSDSLSVAVVMDVETGNNNTVYVATQKNVFISRDNGTTFTEVVGGDKFPRVASDQYSNLDKARMEIAVAPTNKSVIYVAEVNLNGFLAGVWKSVDAGKNWTQIGPRSSAIGTVPINLSFAPLSTTRGGKGVYSLMLAVDPVNENKIFLGGQKLYTYTPELQWVAHGSDFSLPRFPDYVPANIHSFAPHPTDPTIYFFGTDKEIIKTFDKGGSYALATGEYCTFPTIGLGIKENDEIFATSTTSGLIHRFEDHQYDQKFRSLGRSLTGFIQISKIRPTEILVSSKSAIIQRSLDGGENYQTFYGFPESNENYPYYYINPNDKDPEKIVKILAPNTTVPDVADNPNPTTCFVLDEYVPNLEEKIIDVDDNQLIEQYLYFATNQRVWLVKNPFGTVTDEKQPTWSAITAAKLDPQSEISAMAVSNDASHTLFVGTTEGKIFRIPYAHDPDTTLGLYKVEDITPDNAPKRWITSMEVNPSNPDMIIITYGGYSVIDENNFDNNYRVWISTDALSASKPAFSPRHGTLPHIPIYTAKFLPSKANPESSDLLMLGTELGVYYTESINLELSNDEIEWFSCNVGAMERVPVHQINAKLWERKCVEIQVGVQIIPRPDGTKDTIPIKKCEYYLVPAKNKYVYIGTFGRGIFRSKYLDSGKTSGSSLFTEDRKAYQLEIYPNPATFSTNLDINLESPANIQVEVISMDGKTVYQSADKFMTVGKHQLVIPVQDFSKGFYVVKTIIKIENRVEVQSAKLRVE